MEFKAEPIGFEASDGRRYDTEKEATKASMEWSMMAVLGRFYRYRRHEVAREHAQQVLQLEDKGILIIDWDKVEELLKK
jgi:hypothetical protein